MPSNSPESCEVKKRCKGVVFDKLIELEFCIVHGRQSRVMTAVQVLNLGSIISKGEDDRNIDSLFSLDEDMNESGKGTNEPFQVNADLIATGRTCVIGSSGSGKSYTVGVICEELCRNKVPFVIIDIEGEYSGLKEKYEAIWVGDEDNCDLRWSSKIDPKLLAQYAPDCPPLVLDLSEADRPREKVSQFLIALYREISRRRTPYLVILEEADRFSPQSGDRLAIFDEIARRGRKRGLGLMLCTQRPSLVDKNILSQCSNQLIGKLVIKNDINSVAQFFSGHNLPNKLTALSPGEFFALGGMAPEPTRVKMRTRETHHGGMTPKLNPMAVQASVEKMLESLQLGEATKTAAGQDIVVQKPAQLTAATTAAITAIAKPAQLQKYDIKTKMSNDDETTKEEAEEVGEYEEGDGTIVKGKKEEYGPLAMEVAASSANIDSEPGQSNKIMGLAPMIEAESVPMLVKLEKTYRLFGQKENVTRVGLGFRPLVEVAVRIRAGMLKKKFETKYFFLDGVTGKLVEVSGDRLNLKGGVEKLLSLEEGQIMILKSLHPDKGMSLIEAAGQARMLEDEARRRLRGLEDKRLVRSTKVGRAKMYRRLMDIPKIDLFSQPLLKLNELNPDDGFKITKLKIKEAQVREVVKGLWEGADVESFKQFYYPIYLAELVLKGRTRYIWIDGRSGKEIDI